MTAMFTSNLGSHKQMWQIACTTAAQLSLRCQQSITCSFSASFSCQLGILPVGPDLHPNMQDRLGRGPSIKALDVKFGPIDKIPSWLE